MGAGGVWSRVVWVGRWLRVVAGCGVAGCGRLWCWVCFVAAVALLVGCVVSAVVRVGLSGRFAAWFGWCCGVHFGGPLGGVCRLARMWWRGQVGVKYPRFCS